MNDGGTVAAFVTGLQPAQRATVERLTQTVAATGHPFAIAVKWRQLTFAVNGDFHHWICAVSITKKAVVLVFHFGGLLEDPDGLFRAGTSKFGRSLDFQASDEVDERVIQGFVNQAVERLPYFRANWRAIQAGVTG